MNGCAVIYPGKVGVKYVTNFWSLFANGKIKNDPSLIEFATTRKVSS